MTTQESVVHGSVAHPEALPALGRLIETPACAALVQEHGRTLVVQAARTVLSRCRDAARAGRLPREAASLDTLSGAVAAELAQRLASTMRRVFNLTGTVLHTNLGRSVLAEPVLQHVLHMGRAANSLEFNLATGGRGDRDDLLSGLLCELTGAEAATVVNNNAAAVLLTIAALAGGREVVVSRGELVEIGGSFRMPDVMAAAGARMVEVGTTNRTHLRDYEQAITEHTGLLMKVHTSNYEVRGFTASVDEAQLADLARQRGLPLASDLGSGSLVDFTAYGLPREPLPQDKLKAGCDVVTFSGDKLLGGPQAGLIVGRRDIIDRIRRHPLKRALRMGQLSLAALEATLRLYLRPERLASDLPALRMLSRSQADIQALAQRLLPPVAAACQGWFDVEVVSLHSQIGSGSLPGERLPSAGLAMRPSTRRSGSALNRLASAWRALPEPVIGRISDDRFLLDLRCLENIDGFLAQLPALAAHLSDGGRA